MSEPQTSELAYEVRELDCAAIARRIPHRFPFLFLESARICAAREIEGVALWPAGHPILAGHFPDRPIVPGVCQIDALAQLGAVLIAHNHVGAQTSGVLASIRSASFHRAVGPDQPLMLRCRLRELSPSAFLVTGTAACEGRVALRAQIIIAISGGDKT